MQQRLGTTARADRFYADQVLNHLNDRMREFVARQEMFFLATADRHGECDSSFRAGPSGFVQVLDERTLAYPEYRGNGVMASVGNISENPRLGLLMIDFTRDRIGLHINGRARVVLDEEMRAAHPGLPVDPVPGRRAQLWVMLHVEEAYIHCAKHIPHLQKVPAAQRGARAWGTDDVKRKGGDFFGAAAEADRRPPFRRAERKNENVHMDVNVNVDADMGVPDAGGVDSAGKGSVRRGVPTEGPGRELSEEFLDKVERVLARAQPRRPVEDDPEFRGWFA
ncbi:pyridoxamine 5'-phosphate oxidase family protein [Streptomyces halobius]|uniref:Pyridoxamine 5'-phosphate oxidase family protein n=1 Tax=Streptomyces halobius TaxID=2879846 RepID=A0ABY4MNI1_9ACTN|nr:pyridoxamine 5'-phosphate oxidase family protein [Streptomyces halobius]UQA97876.1 pyridoxamine 5'-phosphate oxidase family protein [Streptomyces halobius]